MPAPFDHLHVHQWRIGQLQEADFLRRYIVQLIEVIAQRQNMKTVQHQPQRRAVDGANPFPGLAIAIYMPPPGERLVPHHHALLLRQGRQTPQILNLQFNLCGAVGRYVAAQ
ncbi:hypothetical protein D3C79_313420 [compost metagenome]